jgi:hypothetical protein
MSYVPELPPKPDEASASAFIAELNAIDPDIVHGRPDKAISRARDQAQATAAWPDAEPKLIDAKLVELTRQRFTSPNHPDGFGSAIAAQILAAIRRHICP